MKCIVASASLIAVVIVVLWFCFGRAKPPIQSTYKTNTDFSMSDGKESAGSSKVGETQEEQLSYEGIWLQASEHNGDTIIYSYDSEPQKIIIEDNEFTWTSCLGDDFYSTFSNVEEIENMTYFFDFGAKVRFINNEKGIGEWTLYTDSDTTKEISITLFVKEEKNTFPIIEWEWDDEF